MPSPTTCPACDGELGPAHAVPAAEPALRGENFALRGCRRCGTAVTVGDPPAAAHESGAYRAGRPRLHRAAQPVLAVFDHQRLHLLRALAPPPGRLLDAGAGRGRFVLAAAAAGYEAVGLEPSATLRRDALTAGAPVRGETIEQAKIPAASLDVVCLWHVLEHLAEPGPALTRISGWLRPGGILLVGVPNLASLQARVGGDRWFHLDVPRHRVHFTPAGLRGLLWTRGFTPQRTAHLLAEHNPFGLWQSTVNRWTSEPSYLYQALKRNVPLRGRDTALTALALPLAPVAILTEALAGLARRGGTIAVLATRKVEG